jgi:hypothetical protein
MTFDVSWQHVLSVRILPQIGGCLCVSYFVWTFVSLDVLFRPLRFSSQRRSYLRRRHVPAREHDARHDATHRRVHT